MILLFHYVIHFYFYFLDVDVLRVDVNPLTLSSSTTTVLTSPTSTTVTSKSGEISIKKSASKILNSIGRTAVKTKEKPKSCKEKNHSGKCEAKKENEDGCSGCPQLPSLDDLRYYAYEGDGSTPGSLSSCCSGKNNINNRK